MPRHYIIRLGPLGRVPIPRWTAHGFGFGSLIAMSIWLYQMAYPNQLVSAQQANAALMRTSEEYGKHIGETPENTWADADGAMRVIVYKDHCVAVQRHVSGKVRTYLVVDLDLPPTKTSAPVLDTSVYAAGGWCTDPRFHHEGRFLQRYGQRRGDWVEVWRLFEDRCEHVQMYAPASGAWDTNPDGTPRVRWIRCVH